MSAPPQTAQLDTFLSDSYSTSGHIRRLPLGVQLYTAGSTEAHRAVIILPDMFGWNTGRTRNYADYFASLGYYAVVPKLLPHSFVAHEEGFPSLLDFAQIGAFVKKLAFQCKQAADSLLQQPTDPTEQDAANLVPKVHAMMHHLHDCGVSSIAILAYSWGGWVAANMLAEPELSQRITCAAIAHPSLGFEETLDGNVIELLTRVSKPVLFIPTKGDSDGYRPGGAYLEVLRSRLPSSDCLDLPQAEHGFLPRGVLQRDDNYECVVQTMKRVVEFFQQHES